MGSSSIAGASSKYIAGIGLRSLQANVLPDWLVRWGTRQLLASRLQELRQASREKQLEQLLAFAQSLKEMPIAVNTEDSKEQHYEVPTEFYQLVLGKHLKYSSSYFPTPSSSLDEAEEAMLEIYCERAQLQDGQSILDLGCGWGSLCLYLAAKYRHSEIVGVSHSATQKEFIDSESRKRDLSNLEIITCDMNSFEPGRTFDRILSIEMFEHMKNYQKLMRNCSTWMKIDGLLFIHVFANKTVAYHFKDEDESDWMARNFFSGGTMLADPLLLYFQDDVAIANHWVINGKQYAQTSEEWLKRMDANLPEISRIFEATYGGKDVTKWIVNWRTFFMAVAELFRYEDGWQTSESRTEAPRKVGAQGTAYAAARFLMKKVSVHTKERFVDNKKSENVIAGLVLPTCRQTPRTKSSICNGKGHQLAKEPLMIFKVYMHVGEEKIGERDSGANA